MNEELLTNGPFELGNITINTISVGKNMFKLNNYEMHLNSFDPSLEKYKTHDPFTIGGSLYQYYIEHSRKDKINEFLKDANSIIS